MKLKRRRVQEVPPKIRLFINNVTATPPENIQEFLKGFTWEFEKGDFHHWVELFNHFDSFFEKHIKLRKDLLLENYCSDPPFPKEAVLQILRVIRIILENCSNKHLYTSYVKHLSSLLACTDADIVEAALQTLTAFLKRTVGKYSIKDASLNSKLFALAQGWGGKEEGVGLISCATQSGCDSVAHDLGCTLHFEFYAVTESSNDFSVAEQSSQGLQIIHIPFINSRQETDLELLNKLVTDYKVPNNLRFSLLTRLRFARAFSSLTARQQHTRIRLYAFIVLVQAGGDAEDLASFFNSEPEFIDELVSLLSYEDEVPVKIRTLCLLSLVALCQDRSRQPSVLTALTSGGHRGILSSLMQKAIDSVSNSSKWSVVFAEALLSLVTVLVSSSSSGCSAMREAGFIPTLLPLLKDTNPQHLHLVSTALHILEAFMDYSNTATSLFRDLGGLDDTISRLKAEVSFVDNDLQQKSEDTSSGMSTQVASSSSTDSEDMQPLYSEALLSYNRKLLIKALLRAISLGTYPPGNTSRVCGSEESLLPDCLCLIFKKPNFFGGGVFSLAASVMSDLLHKDPTCFPTIDAAGLPSAFLDAIMDGVLCSAEAISCIPQSLDALCLNNSGLQAVKDRNALRCFVKIFTSRTYLRALCGDTPGSLSGGLDELMRHASSLRGPGVDMLIEILTTISSIGSSTKASLSLTESPCSTVPMETDLDDKSSDIAVERESSSMDNSCVAADPSDASVMEESFLPDCVSNVARLLETILQNSDTCRIFVDKKGIEAVLQLFTLPLMPLSVSVGQNVSVAFKNFSPQHSASMARAVCSFLRGHLKTTDELLSSVGDAQLTAVECAKQTEILRCLSGLEGILSLSNFLLKGTASVVSELGATDADVLKDLGRTYKEIIWQISVCCDSKVEENKNVVQEPENIEAASSGIVGRESDDDANIGVVRHINPAATSTSTQPIWGGERDFLTVVRSGEHLNRRNRYGFSRVRGGRASRHLEALSIDSDVPSSVPETSSQDLRKKSPEVHAFEILTKVASTMRSFFIALVKGFTSSYRRRADSGSLSLASKTLGTALAKVFLEALSFSGHSSVGVDMSLSVKCRYLGKVVNDMAALTFDSRRRTCYQIMVNSFYVHGTLKELLTTFEATSQLLLLYNLPTSSVNHEKGGDESKMSTNTWLLDTLQSYCQVLEYFVNSALIMSQTPPAQAQLVVQPVGLSIGLFPVPKDPEAFVRMLQSQVLEVILPVWKSPMFPNCHPAFIASIILLVNHIYSGVGDVKHHRAGASASTIQRVPPPDESSITRIVDMGFPRARAEVALRRVGSNSVELAMEWIVNHPEDPVQEDDELARALALSLGNSSETSKADAVDKSVDVVPEEGQTKAPSVDDILAASLNMFQTGGSVAFPLTDLFVTLCNRNKGEDRQKVVSHLTQQLKLCPLDFSKDTSSVSMLSHIIALILFEDVATREIAADNGIVSTIINILTDFKTKNEVGSEILAPRCISVLLLILDNMVQSRQLMFTKSKQEISMGSMSDLSGEHFRLSDSSYVEEKKSVTDGHEKEPTSALEKILGKSTGYLTTQESHKALVIACDLIKQQAPAVIMQASLQLCARLTKTHSLASQFLENGGLAALFSLPKRCIFPGFDTVASSIVRHLLEDPLTLQSSMELEIRQTLCGNRHAGGISPRTFLTSMAPLISRDPLVFMKAATSICQLESSGGSTYVVFSKEKEKEKDKSKAPAADPGLSSLDSIKISENKVHDGLGKYSKGHKKIPANLNQVVDQLLEIILKYQPMKMKDDYSDVMEIDDMATKSKGKSKVDETKVTESVSEKSAVLATVTFVLKLLSDILLMYVQAAGLILRRDLEFSELHGSNQSDGPHVGLLHHVLHRLLPLSSNKSAGPDEWRDKLSEKASWFLVVLCGRSGEGRKRVISELVKALSSFSNVESNSVRSSLLPDKKVRAFADLVYSILSKSSSSCNLPGSSCSPDIARSMIDGGIIRCLTDILQVIDLDHPDAPKVVNLLLKALEILTRAANASEQVSKSDGTNKKKHRGLNERSETLEIAPSASDNVEHNQNTSHQQVTGAAETEQPSQRDASPHVGNHDDNQNGPEGQIAQGEAEETMATIPEMQLETDFLREDIEGNDADQIEMTFRVENQADDDMGDEDDDMADDGEDDDDDEEGEDEDDDIAEDGAGMMSLADTDVEDHEDTGLGDEFNDEMIDEEDDFHGNRVVEVWWREALDGVDQVFGQSGSGGGLIDVAAEPFEGVNIDDLFGIRRPLGFERRRQANRSSFERPAAEANGFQHPLLTRPSQSRDLASIWSSTWNSSRGLEAGSTGSFDLTNLDMPDPPDPPVNPHDNEPDSFFSDRFSSVAPQPISDYSVGVDTIRLPRRRGSTDGRWTDDGQPQASTQAADIAQSLEEEFLSQLRSVAPSSSPAERHPQQSGVLEKEQPCGPSSNVDQIAVEGNNHGSPQYQRPHEDSKAAVQETNQVTESVSSQEQVNPGPVVQETCEGPQHEPMSVQPISINVGTNFVDIMEIADASGSTPRAEDERSEHISGSVDVHGNLEYEEGSEVPEIPLELPTAGSDESSRMDNRGSIDAVHSSLEMPNPIQNQESSVNACVDVDMNGGNAEDNQSEHATPASEFVADEHSSRLDTAVSEDNHQAEQSNMNNEASGANAIDPTFLDALPEDLRAEVLASQQAQSVQPPAYVPPSMEDIDPEFLAALPPDIQAEVLAQQRAQRVAHQAEGQPVEMDNASIIATLPPDLREEVLLTSSEAVLSALPSPLLAEAQMLRDRAMSHYQARSLFGTSHRLSNRRNGLGFDRHAAIDRGVGFTVRRAATAIANGLKMKEIEGEPVVDTNGLKALIRLLRLAQPLGKGLLQRILLNLCAHSVTRENLVHLLLDMIKPEVEGSASGVATVNSLRLFGCRSSVVYSRSQLLDGLPPLVLRRILEILIYLATNHSSVANMLFCFDNSVVSNTNTNPEKDKGKEKAVKGVPLLDSVWNSEDENIPLRLFLRLLNRPLFSRSSAHLEQVMGLIQIIVYTAASKSESLSSPKPLVDSNNQTLPSNDVPNDPPLLASESNGDEKDAKSKLPIADGRKSINVYDTFLRLPLSDLRNLCSLLGHEGLSDKVYMLAGEVIQKLSAVAAPHQSFFTSELSELAHELSSSAVSELITLRSTNMLGLSAGSMAGAAILRVLQTFNSLTSSTVKESVGIEGDWKQDEQATMLKLNAALEPLWQELSNCISVTDSQLDKNSSDLAMPDVNLADFIHGAFSMSPPLPPGTHRLLPFIEAFFVLCERLQANNPLLQQDQASVTATEVKESTSSSASFTKNTSGESQRKLDGVVTFSRFAEKHRRLLNAFIRQNPSLLEKSLSMMLKTQRLIDFDNKRAYFRSRVRQQNEHHLSGPLRISVRRAYILEDSYNQLRMRPSHDLKGRLNVHFQGEEGIDAGGLTREWYQVLSRVLFDKGALLFTTVGNNATFQPNPNSVYQTEHLSYFKFVGRVVAKALYDAQHLDIYFTRSFYKHILGSKVTYHDIEAVDPDYYKNLKWMLENDVSDIPDLTFSMDADEEKHILYEKNQVTDYELKPGGRNIRVTEETKHEYVDLVADHILTNAIRPQINAFLEGFNELVPRELISVFNDKELELLISGLPEIDLDDLRANTEYTGYTATSSVVQWFWNVVKDFGKEDMARLVQFVTGTSKVPLEGFKALQGISGPQRFQIHKAYGAPERLPSAHTCFNQLDLPEYSSRDQLEERLMIAIHEASEGFGFG